MKKPLSEEKVFYVQYQITSGRDKVKGYVENFREYN
jgi:hypothetical protein